MKKIFILFVGLIAIIGCKENTVFFKKNIPEIKESWAVSQGEYNSLPLIIRKNNGAKVISGKNYLNFRSGISFQLLEKTENGLQTENEGIIINQIEDKIFELFDDQKTATVTTIISTSNIKEFIIYHNGNISFSEKIKTIQENFPKYIITSYTKEDKKWEVFNQY